MTATEMKIAEMNRKANEEVEARRARGEFFGANFDAEVPFDVAEVYQPTTDRQVEVKITYDAQLVEALWGTDYSKHPDYQDMAPAIREWLNRNNAAYYSDEKPGFSVYRGAVEALDAGKRWVICENLS
jgi:hypothetical protein